MLLYYVLVEAGTSVGPHSYSVHDSGFYRASLLYSAKYSRENIFANLQILAQTVIFAGKFSRFVGWIIHMILN